MRRDPYDLISYRISTSRLAPRRRMPPPTRRGRRFAPSVVSAPSPSSTSISAIRSAASGKPTSIPAADFLVLPATHTFIMNRLDVAEATVDFLRYGRFGQPGGA